MFPGTGFCTQPLYFVNCIVGRKVLPCSRKVSPPPFCPAPVSTPSHLACLVLPTSPRPPRLVCLVPSASSRLSRPTNLAARSHPFRLVASCSACLGITSCPLSFAVSAPCRYTHETMATTTRRVQGTKYPRFEEPLYHSAGKDLHPSGILPADMENGERYRHPQARKARLLANPCIPGHLPAGRHREASGKDSSTPNR